jgi:hypothetical protein
VKSNTKKKRKERKKNMSATASPHDSLRSLIVSMMTNDVRRFAESGLVDGRLDLDHHVLAAQTTSPSPSSVPDYIARMFPMIHLEDDSKLADLRRALIKDDQKRIVIDNELTFPSLHFEDFAELFDHIDRAVNGFRSGRVLPRPEHSVLWLMLKDLEVGQPKICVSLRGMKGMVYGFFADLSPLDPKRFCDHCGPKDGNQTLKLCGGCKAVRYCRPSEEGRRSCQKEAWDAHKLQCPHLSAAMTEAKAKRRESA